MIKFTILLRRHENIIHEDFVWYHKNNHAPLFASLAEVKENVRRYVQCYSLDVTMPGLPAPQYDGITELWFDEVESIGKVFNAKPYLELIRPDEEKFLDLHGCGFIISIENPVI
ncbi:EthD domain-containing protein [Dyadobacter chenwenxiniae]|uniref:EthD domain-containing protein n=1 Tax=Dyadobacter chenwenxiniae TaxID=2906456 RepID=A0A9X1TGH8_9BACT|nr:EthD domain-containing protein [Dyadobacter chenwenxiniae]MCF0065576.1 EthD domain-containing protein [Dyadobacter chenwenxiniae]UON85487.1 EthD domain-containing protein [Dyadobacter chenwenxiniae]